MIYDIQVDGKLYRLALERSQSGFKCELNNKAYEIDAAFIDQNLLSLVIGGKSFRIRREQLAGRRYLWLGEQRFEFEISDPRSLRAKRLLRGTSDGPVSLIAPMPGKIVRVLVGENATVQAGQGLVVVEAMKMQNEVKSPKDGRVRRMAAKEGAPVNAGDVLATVE